MVALSGVEIYHPMSLIDAAERAVAKEGRSGRQQLEHRARVGRSVSEQARSSRNRVDQALAGTIAPKQLCAIESTIFNVEVEDGIEKKMFKVNYARLRAKLGLSSVALDFDGKLVEHLPNGTTRKLNRP